MVYLILTYVVGVALVLMFFRGAYLVSQDDNEIDDRTAELTKARQRSANEQIELPIATVSPIIPSRPGVRGMGLHGGPTTRQ
mgnify:CR=1 FL=1